MRLHMKLRLKTSIIILGDSFTFSNDGHILCEYTKATINIYTF